MNRTLGKVLYEIHCIKRQANGIWLLLLPDTYALSSKPSLTPDIPCKVVFITNEEYESSEIISVDGMSEFVFVSLAQEVVLAARGQKLGCTEEELVMCLEYYLERDAFYIFDDDTDESKFDG